MARERLFSFAGLWKNALVSFQATIAEKTFSFESIFVKISLLQLFKGVIMNVCMLFCDGFEEIEALAVIDILRRAKVSIEMIGVTNGSVESAVKVTVKMDKILSDVAASGKDYDMVILPGGGLGTANLERSDLVKSFVMRHASAGKKIAAICAAPSVLAGYGLLKGKKATCYPAVREKLNDAIYVEESVVVDGNIITSRGPATACAFGFRILEELGQKEAALEWQEKMLFTEDFAGGKV
jgi:4-methyl-5(b-hydroxyethyl)-thiazole monophosphate biosynthesis